MSMRAPEPGSVENEKLHPHAVHVKGGGIAEERSTVRTYDRDRAPKSAKIAGEDVYPEHWELQGGAMVQVPEVRIPYWEIDDLTRRYVGPTDCPDCGWGLSSRGDSMVCPRLFKTTDLHACHDHCIVACGWRG